MKKILLVARMALGTNVMAAAVPENAESESCPAMVAFYDAQCKEWADEKKCKVRPGRPS